MRTIATFALGLLAGVTVTARAQEAESPRTGISILPAEIASHAFAEGVPDLQFELAWEWQALVCHKKCELKSVKLLMTPALVQPYDGEVMPGHVYTIDRKLDAQPLVLMRELPDGVRTRPETYLHAGMEKYPPSSTPGTMEIDIPVPGEPARIVPRYARQSDNSDLFNVYLETKGRSQLLARIHVDVVAGPSGMARGPQLLRWAGDLDGDGKLDLIMNLSSRYGEDAAATLFLSSAAKPGEMVGMAAGFRYWPVGNPGC
jgi:hypothetical protein